MHNFFRRQNFVFNQPGVAHKIMSFVEDYIYTVAGTLAVFFYYAATAMSVGSARYKYGVKAPATTGHIEFEKRYRVQMNALENLVVCFSIILQFFNTEKVFVPLMWICVLLGYKDLYIGICAAVWVFGRTIYFYTYLKSPETRILGFLPQLLAQNALMIAASITVGKTLMVKMFD